MRQKDYLPNMGSEDDKSGNTDSEDRPSFQGQQISKGKRRKSSSDSDDS
jgi:hypothetical protein